MKRTMLSVLALVLAATAAYAQKPVDLYRIELPEGYNGYYHAARMGWPTYYVSDNVLLVGGDVRQGLPKGSQAAMVYRGDIGDLRWVFQRRNAPPPSIKAAALFDHKNAFLFKTSAIDAGITGSPGSYWVKPVRKWTLNARADTTLINPNLAYDVAIAELVNRIDSAKVKACLDTMQAFPTRHCQAGNHATVVNWVKNKYLSLGLTDVRTDTFNVSSSPVGHNIIASLPGSVDTHTVYVTGGHYDTYRTGWSPGADDNASGAVAALELARAFMASGQAPNSTVKFLAFDAEELGLYGSDYYAQKALDQGMNIGCMLNFDMFGAINNDSMFLSQQYAGSEAYAQLLIRMARFYGSFALYPVAAQIGTQYLAQSDSYEFHTRGYRVAWTMEKNESQHYHQPSDSIRYMSMRYLTGNLRASMGLLATLANYPAKVQGIAAENTGTGTQLAVTWSKAGAANVSGYKVYWGTTPGNLTNSQVVSGAEDTTDTITGLTNGTTYYIAVAAVNTLNQESVFLIQTSARTFSGTPQQVFYDDFENGLGQWARGHSGGTVDWDTTGGSYHSAGHSATDSRAGLYLDNVNNWLQMASGLNLTGYTAAFVSWWERYATESGYDYCNPEYSTNGGTSWNPLLPHYAGSAAWAQRLLDISGYCASAAAFKLRFRFTSDGSQVDDGWYVDDVKITGYQPTGVAHTGPSPEAGTALLNCFPNPTSGSYWLNYRLDHDERVTVSVYDVAGRMVATLFYGNKAAGEHRMRWDGRNLQAKKVSNGIYFYRFLAGGYRRLGKIQLVR